MSQFTKQGIADGETGSTLAYDTNLNYSRIIGLQASGKNMYVEKALKYKLVPIPSSMFANAGEIRLAPNKIAPKNKLRVDKNCTQSYRCDHRWLRHNVIVLWLRFSATTYL